MSKNFPFGWCSFHVLSNKLRHTQCLRWILQCDACVLKWWYNRTGWRAARWDQVCVRTHALCYTFMNYDKLMHKWMKSVNMWNFSPSWITEMNKRCRKCGYLTHQDFLLIRYSSVSTLSSLLSAFYLFIRAFSFAHFTSFKWIDNYHD